MLNDNWYDGSIVVWVTFQAKMPTPQDLLFFVLYDSRQIPLAFGLLVEQINQFEHFTFSSRNCFWHFVDKIINLLIEKIIDRFIYKENNHWLQPYSHNTAVMYRVYIVYWLRSNSGKLIK